MVDNQLEIIVYQITRSNESIHQRFSKSECLNRSKWDGDACSIRPSYVIKLLLFFSEFPGTVDFLTISPHSESGSLSAGKISRLYYVWIFSVSHFSCLWDFTIGWVTCNKLSLTQFLMYLTDFYVPGLIRKIFQCITRHVYNISHKCERFNVVVQMSQ